MIKSFAVDFGALADPLSKQLAHFQLEEKALERLEGMTKSATHLLIWGVMTEGEAHKVRQRIMKKIRVEIETKHL